MGRVVVVLILCVYFALLLALGGHRSWNRLGVPDLSPSFLDMRSVTTGWVCTRRGIDVLPMNPCDPLKRPANYPRIWMGFSFLGLGPASTVPLGLLNGAVFLIAAIGFFMYPRSGLLGAVLYGAALCSPAVMLGIERGNVDLTLFAVVTLAVVVARRERFGPVLAGALILAAAVLKLFPIFSLGLLARQRQRVFIGGSVLVIFAAYALVTLGDIRTIGKVVPQASAYSYGLDISGRWLAGPLGTTSLVSDVALAALALSLAVVAGTRLRSSPDSRPSTARGARDLDAFWAGAGVYVGPSCLFHSFDYRLVFLPARRSLSSSRWALRAKPVAWVSLGALLMTVWLVGPSVLRPGEIAQTVLLAGLVAGLIATVPIPERRTAQPAT